MRSFFQAANPNGQEKFEFCFQTVGVDSRGRLDNRKPSLRYLQKFLRAPIQIAGELLGRYGAGNSHNDRLYQAVKHSSEILENVGQLDAALLEST